MKNKHLANITLFISVILTLPFVSAISAPKLNVGTAFSLIGQLLSQLFANPKSRFGIFFILLWWILYLVLSTALSHWRGFESSAGKIAGATAGIMTVAISVPIAKDLKRLDSIMGMLAFFGIVFLLGKLLLRLNNALPQMRSAVRMRREQRRKRKWLGWFKKEQHQEVKKDEDMLEKDEDLVDSEKDVLSLEQKEDRELEKAHDDAEKLRKILANKIKPLGFELLDANSRGDIPRAEYIDKLIRKNMGYVNDYFVNLVQRIRKEYEESKLEHEQIIKELNNVKKGTDELRTETHDLEIMITQLEDQGKKDIQTSSFDKIELQELKRKLDYNKRLFKIRKDIERLLEEQIFFVETLLKETETLWNKLNEINANYHKLAMNIRDYREIMDNQLISLIQVINHLIEVDKRKEQDSKDVIRLGIDEVDIQKEKIHLSELLQKQAKRERKDINKERRVEIGTHDSDHELERSL